MAREGGGVCHPSALLGRERVGCPVRCASGPFERAGQGCTGWREGSGQGGNVTAMGICPGYATALVRAV
jgi:hypothetical protein